MKVQGNLGERRFARGALAAAIEHNAVTFEYFAAPRFRYEFECLRARDVVAASELRRAIDEEKMRAAAAWLEGGEAGAILFDARKLFGLQRELDALRRDVIWREDRLNLVFTAGKNDLLDKYFAGSTYTAAFYMGLVDGASSPTYANGDTMASHSGWTESTAYSNTNRVTLAFSAASAGSKALSSAATFNINATATIAGAFFATNNTKGGTTGICYSGSNFTGGNRSVSSGDTLNVSATQAV